MEPLESTSQSFIVKVWVEDSPHAGDPGVWHGHITHVPSGERYYMDDLKEVPIFIAPYLEAMGVRPKMRRGLRYWLKSLKLRD